MLQLVGDYRYSGATVNGRRYSIIRNGVELVRVRRIAEGAERENPLLWDASMPMTPEVLGILKHEQHAST